MAGESYTGGGIRTTVAATRAATDEQLAANVARHVAEMRRQGTTTVEIKSGYGLTVPDEARSLASPGSSPRRPPSSAPTSCPRSTTSTWPATSTWSPGRCSRPRHRTHAGSTSSASAAPSTPTRRAPSSPRGRPRPAAGGCTPTSSDPARASGWPASSVCRAVDHCTFLDDDDVAAWLAPARWRRCCPGVEFSTRSPYPDARGLLDAGVTVALATDCNPGLSYTSSMPLCVALAVREMRMTPAEALWSATAGGARALGRDDVGVLAPGKRARTSPCWRHPRTCTWPTDPVCRWWPTSSGLTP